jgi:predicted enzyme related to lactoylglutathione lyase
LFLPQAPARARKKAKKKRRFFRFRQEAHPFGASGQQRSASMSMSNPRAIGIGGVFLYADNAKTLAEWYEKHLGIKLENWGSCFGHVFHWSETGESGGAAGTTTWAIHQAKQPLPADRPQMMVNYRVPNLDQMMEKLRSEGIEVALVEEGEFGRFAHARDPEGNRIELWQPAPGM